ncbi:MAG: hypothetical protein GOP50_00045 [Candidatus Heimdallarchaeota archaeon]|nr:hypothetical protein [Candidatus Heimdallarchaeota archaeon]
MKKYLAFICGHFLPIGYEEFYACLEAEGIVCKNVLEENQIIIFDSEKDPTVAAARCAFLHALILLTDVGEVVEDKVHFKAEHNHLEIEPNKSFAVRVRKIGRKEIKLRSVDLERILGGHIYHKFEEAKLDANLKAPYYSFIAVLLKKKLFLGLELWSQDRKKYAVREPGVRDYFRPGAMRTDFARAIVNLSRVKQGDTFFDPFCGGGGFLLEAFELGAYSIGSDLDGFAIQGSKENLSQFKNFNTSIYRGDSRYLAIKAVDAIATDPPYSLQSSTHGADLSDLVYEFLIDARKVLKSNGFLVFSAPAAVAPEKIVEKTDYKLVTLIDCVIHKSLTRRILVLR